MYYIYEKSSSKIVENVRHRPYRVTRSYKTHAAAQAAITRMSKAAHRDLETYNIDTDPQFTYGIAEAEHYHKHIEKYETVYSIMDHQREHPIRQSVNTPHYCSPSSEAYWSM